MLFKSGFTLIEVMIAVAVIGILMSNIGTLETTLLHSVVKYSELFNRVSQEIVFLHESSVIYTDKPLEKKLDALTLRYTQKSLPKESPLAALCCLQLVLVEGFRETGQQDKIVTVIYKTPDKKKKKNE